MHESHDDGGFGEKKNGRPRTRRTPGLLPSWAPLPALLNRSGWQATTSRIQPPGWPPLSASSSRCTRTTYSTMTAPISRQQHSRAAVWCRRQHCCKCRRKPAASARRLPRQRPRQTRPSAAQPPPRGIQTESGFPPGVLQLSGPFRRPSPIPSHRRLTQQLTKHWPKFKALRQHYASTRFEEQCQLQWPQKHKATVLESTLLVEKNGLEEQADNAKARDLYWKPLSGPSGPRVPPMPTCRSGSLSSLQQ